MEKGLIITLPNYDDATSYLEFYSKEIISEAQNKGIKVAKNSGDNIKNFSDFLNKLNYNFIVFNGHGDEDCIYGYKNEVLIKVGKNENLLKERIIYARSCNAGSVLGVECTKDSEEGCFIGYNLPFVFFIDQNWSTKPNNDNVARLFLEPSNSIPLSLIKGNTAFDSYMNSKKSTLKNMKKVLKNEKEPGAQYILEGLWNNYLGQVILGNQRVKI